MAVLRSPGVVVREVDLTAGRADITNGNIAAFAAPFSKGPIGEPVTITRESELISTFGEPTAANAEYWLSATNYLNYGGTLSVSRVDQSSLYNAVARLNQSVSAVSITNVGSNYTSAPVVTFSAPELALVDGGRVATGTANRDPITGTVTSVTITDGGAGYQNPPTVTFAPVGLTATLQVSQGTTATADGSGITNTGGVLDSTTLTVGSGITEAGSGYSADPTITVDGGNNDATVSVVRTNGQITSITISGGTGYNAGVTAIAISAPTGVEVSVDNAGSNYDPADTYTVTFSGGAAVTAAVATLSVSAGGSVTGVTFTQYGNYTNFAGLTATAPGPGTTATGSTSVAAEPFKISRDEVYESSYSSGNTAPFLYTAKTAGAWGNSIRIATVDRGPRQSLTYSAAITAPALGSFVSVGTSKKGKVIDTGLTESGNLIVHIIHVDQSDSYLRNPGTSALFAVGDVTTGVAGTLASVDNGEEWYQNKTLYTGSSTKWNSLVARPGTTQDAENFLDAQAYDAVHVAVVDEDGLISGAKGTVLEVFQYASKAYNARSPQGGSNYFKDVISSSSEYIYVGATNFGYLQKTSEFEPVGTRSYSLSAGSDYNTLSSGEFNISTGDIDSAYNLFRNTDSVSIDYIIMGPGLQTENETRAKLSNISSIAAERKDCIAFGSPHKGNILSASGQALSNSDIVRNIKNFYSAVGSNSYLVIDSNYKYVYDRWNDVYRYIPCNTDVAGLVADTVNTNEPWFSPAGFSRGGIRNLAKLAWNPGKNDRDELYANRINPIAVFPGQGAVLFGDKTALANPSAFDRINVRKLFLVIEKAIEQAAQAQLFEINDQTTRNVFKSVVEPFLRDVQARRGIFDFRVICDTTNNTPAVIDNNEFVAEIYIQPARSINFITLTFTATRTGVSFDEIIGR